MFLCLTASHHNASFTLLEKLSVGAPLVAATVTRDARNSVRGVVVIATCNRFEAYLDVDDLSRAIQHAISSTLDILAAASNVNVAEIRGAVTVLSGNHVAEHLFAVSSGLESVAVGEGEIAGQVRRALDIAREQGTVTSDLERLFQNASRTSRGVKARTGLGHADRSLVRLALDLASSRVTDWEQSRVLLLGTGRYARASLAALRQRGATDIRVFSPSGRATQFTQGRNLATVEQSDLVRAIAECDIVVACSVSDRHLINTDHVAAARDHGDHRERQFYIDFGLPRNIDPEIAQMAGIEFLDLELIRLHAPLTDLNATDEARTLVAAAAADFGASLADAAIAPAVVALRKHVFDALDAEIARARRRGDSEATEGALRHLAGVLLHTPSVRARTLARAGESDRFTEALEVLFGVLPEPRSAPIIRIDAERTSAPSSHPQSNAVAN